MASVAIQLHPETWLLEHGPRELELLFRAIVYHPSAPLLITDNDRRYRDASSGAGRLLGLPRDQIIGRSLDEFAAPASKPVIPDLWQEFLQRGEQQATLSLLTADGAEKEVAFTAKRDILPVRHLVILQEKVNQQTASVAPIPAWVQDYALSLLGTDGHVVAWYAGAERIFGYSVAEAAGQHESIFYPGSDGLALRLREERQRTATEGHFGDEVWCMKKSGERFWASVITTSMRDSEGNLRGFARVVRDFSDRRERDQKLRRGRTRIHPPPIDTAVAGVVSGEFERMPEVNDAFLELIGYSREDVAAGRLNWPDLTAPEYFQMDELAHEESLRFGACTPFEKELIRKDGTRIPVLVATAVLKLSPFRWISFVQDLRGPKPQALLEEVTPEITWDFNEIVGRSAPLKRLLVQVQVVAPTNATVLILGETGTGKELVARAIHKISPRRDRAFVTLNCAAIPTGLLESELFGYERGAFTGALSQKIGRFEMAHKGTLFLDEVGDIPIELQPKLLRALQEKSFERLGGTKTIPIDVRLVAATNRNLTEMMTEKLFRPDLYYRLKVFPVTTPPLRDRPDDIPVLVRHFTQKYAAELGRKIETIPPDVMKALVSWSWPGNIRELENFIERSVILSPGSDLRAPLAEIRAVAPPLVMDSTLDFIEHEHILRILRETDGSVSKAATRLGMPRTTLNALMKKLHITRKDI